MVVSLLATSSRMQHTNSSPVFRCSPPAVRPAGERSGRRPGRRGSRARTCFAVKACSISERSYRCRGRSIELMLDDKSAWACSPLGRPRSDEEALKSDRVRCTPSSPSTVHLPDFGSTPPTHHALFPGQKSVPIGPRASRLRHSSDLQRGCEHPLTFKRDAFRQHCPDQSPACSEPTRFTPAPPVLTDRK
jgi:hypothetical protein